MNKELFDSMIYGMIYKRLLYMLILYAVVFIPLGLKIYHKKTGKPPKTKRNKRKKQQSERDENAIYAIQVIASIIVTAVFVPSIVTMYKDISQSRYVQAEVDLEYHIDRQDWAIVKFEDRENKIALAISPLADEDQFSYGEHHGIIWYAPESEVLFSFEPTQNSTNP